MNSLNLQLIFAGGKFKLIIFVSSFFKMSKRGRYRKFREDFVPESWSNEYEFDNITVPLEPIPAAEIPNDAAAVAPAETPAAEIPNDAATVAPAENGGEDGSRSPTEPHDVPSPIQSHEDGQVSPPEIPNDVPSPIRSHHDGQVSPPKIHDPVLPGDDDRHYDDVHSMEDDDPENNDDDHLDDVAPDLMKDADFYDDRAGPMNDDGPERIGEEHVIDENLIEMECKLKKMKSN